MSIEAGRAYFRQFGMEDRVMEFDVSSATVDLGTSKLALCVAKVVGDDVQIIYYKERPSNGIRYNCVFNPMRAAAPIPPETPVIR